VSGARWCGWCREFFAAFVCGADLNNGEGYVEFCSIDCGDKYVERGCSRSREPGSTLPSWVEVDAMFGLDGRLYRVVSVGSTNRRTRLHETFEPMVHAEPMDASPWRGLPDAPATKSDVGAALQQLFALPVFFHDDLARAIRLVAAVDAPETVTE
jgi:predicted RNA-binding Zn-ribbon protein involved in translation (DUF1610 family)